MLNQQLLEVFHEFGIEDVELTAATSLQDELGMDSQEIAQLIYRVERKFRFTIPNRTTAIKDLTSIGRVMALIEQYAVQPEVAS